MRTSKEIFDDLQSTLSLSHSRSISRIHTHEHIKAEPYENDFKQTTTERKQSNREYCSRQQKSSIQHTFDEGRVNEMDGTKRARVYDCLFTHSSGRSLSVSDSEKEEEKKKRTEQQHTDLLNWRQNFMNCQHFTQIRHHQLSTIFIIRSKCEALREQCVCVLH